MGSDPVTVSICLPVRNGQRYLHECIDSILSQTFTDFELIVCDNASTDSTESICREYVRTDQRVRYIRHPENIGPAGNHNSGFSFARGKYVHWQAHDDCITPDYLARCVEVLERDPSVVLVFPQAKVIDENSQEIEQYDFTLDTATQSVTKRFRSMCLAPNRQHRNLEVFGLIRASALRQIPTELEGEYAHSDRVFVVRLALLGRFEHIPAPLFISRSHGGQSVQTLPKKHGKKLARFLGPGPLPPPEWWNPKLANRVVFADWNLLREYFRSINFTPLNLAQRIGCYLTLGQWIFWFWPKLVRDLAFAIETLFAHVSRRISQADEEPETAGST